LRPIRSDIAAPPLPPETGWAGEPVPSLERLLAAAPVLVHFFDFAQLNCVRSLPYLRAWRQRYRSDGLAVVGIHSPRFPFTRSPSAVAESLPRLEIEWPVALDPDLALWREYGCRGWPSVFLWGRGGALRWYHLGEGEYEATEEAIRGALQDAGADPGGWSPPLEPLRPGDAPGAEVVVPTAEVLPGGSLERPLPGGEPLPVDYEGAGAYAAVDGEGRVAVRLDGDSLEPVVITHPGLYELVEHPHHQRHRLELQASPGVSVYSLQFAAGPPG
jgi:hypothetical protein